MPRSRSASAGAPEVDAWLAGAKRWREESARLRSILLDCGLTEALKWGKPCYASDGKNVAILQPMKRFLALMFFEGALLEDTEGWLERQGEASRSARRVCFTSVEQVVAREGAVRDYVRQAVEAARGGREVPKQTAALVLAPELQSRLDGDPALAAAFGALTRGRQREYNLFVSGAKQEKTRASRVEKHVARILAGKGMRDE